MNYTDVKNPQWVNAEHTLINCDVDFDDLNEQYVPFTANPSDTSNPSSKQIFDECAAGIWGDVAEYIPPPPYVPTADDNKQTAIALLQQTDWTSVADVGNPEMSNPYLANQTEFISYRNAVRQYAINPVEGNIDWPAMPQEDWQTV
jgi:hypothetical protein